MTEFITKEEIKQWRSSVEKITLEEFAARLGKTIEETKKTHDIIDIIYNENSKTGNKNNLNNKDAKFYPKPEKIESLIKPLKVDVSQPKAVEPQKPVVKKIEEVKSLKIEEPKQVEEVKKIEQVQKTEKIEVVEIKPLKVDISQPKAVEPQKPQVEKKEKIQKPVKSNSTSGELIITFNKELTDREQSVLEHLKQNRGKIVFAKDLAELLNLKRDYIYKYIKNLRSKIVEDVLQNSDQGGFILK